MKFSITDNNQKGVSLIITFFIMIIILGVVLSVSTILYSEIKVIRNIGNSVVAFYSADSGIEKILYYDRQIKAQTGTEADGTTPIYAKRGLCSLCDYNRDTNPNACYDNPNNTEDSLKCLSCTKNALDMGSGGSGTGCDPDKCDNCEIKFNTILNGDSNVTYNVDAKVTPSTDAGGTTSSDLTIDSNGLYQSVNRAIELNISKTETVTPTSAPTIGEAYLIENSIPTGINLHIVANNILDPDGIGSVSVEIRSGTTVVGAPVLSPPVDGTSPYSGIGTWQTSTVGDYDAYIKACDVNTNCTDWVQLHIQ